MDKYILVDRIPVKCDNNIEFSKWFEDSKNRIVKQDHLSDGRLISTVFLGYDHSWFGGPPTLFETMILNDISGNGEYQERCSTWEEAERQHAKALATVAPKPFGKVDFKL